MNDTIKELEKVAQPMQSPAMAIAQLAQHNNQAQVNPNLVPNQQVPAYQAVPGQQSNNELPDEKKAQLIELLVQKKDLALEDATEIVANLNNKDKYHFGMILSPRSAVTIHEAMKKLNLNGSVCEFYELCLVSMFLADRIDLSLTAQYKCHDVAEYVLACANIGLNPTQRQYVVPVFSKETTEIKPLVLLAGFEKLIFDNGDCVKVKYVESERTELVNMPIDPNMDLDAYDLSSMYWDSNKTPMPSHVTCTISYKKDNKEYEVEGCADIKSDICLTPYWAKMPMQMLRHVAFKRAAKLIIHSPILTSEEVAIENSMSANRRQLQKEIVEQMKAKIENCPENELVPLRKRIEEKEDIFGVQSEKLIALIDARLKLNGKTPDGHDIVKTVKRTVSVSSADSGITFKQVTNDDIPPVQVTGVERDRVLRELAM